MVFFTDRDMGGVIFPRVLRDAGLAVEVHRDHFPPNAPDAEWLPEVARRGWVIVTGDQNMLRVPLERDAIMRSGGRAFLLVAAEQLAWNFVNTLAQVEALLTAQPPPFIAKVFRPNPVADVADVANGKPGKVELKLTSATWVPST